MKTEIKNAMFLSYVVPHEFFKTLWHPPETYNG